MRRLVSGAVAALMAPLVLVALADTSPAARPRGDACGSLLPKGDGTAWRCTFVDHFGADELDRGKWIPQTQMLTGTDGAYACHVDDPSTVRQWGGSLRLTVRRAPAPVECMGTSAPYISGMVSTFYRFAQQYGRFEARVKVAAATAPGLHEAFWLWPDVRVSSTDDWPASGEIDVAETYSSHPDIAVPFLHYTANDNGGPVPGLNTAWDCPAARGVWNTYTLTWTATRIEITINGRTCLVNTSGDPAFQKPYIIALTQALGTAANGFTGSAPIPATMQVDYVKAWR